MHGLHPGHHPGAGYSLDWPTGFSFGVAAETELLGYRLPEILHRAFTGQDLGGATLRIPDRDDERLDTRLLSQSRNLM